MPLYEFKCPLCEQTIEKMQRYDDPVPVCESCGHFTKRQISRTSFTLKGDGWYKDGYSKPVPKKD